VFNEQRFPKGWDERTCSESEACLPNWTLGAKMIWFAADAVVTVPTALLPEIRRPLATPKTA